MTDHLSDLDERGRTAAADLRARAATRPVPRFDVDEPLRLPAPAPNGAGRSRRPLLAVAAVLILVAGAAVWVTARSGDDDPTPVAVANGEVLPMLATDLPAGFELAGVADAAPNPDAASAEYGPLFVFGPADAEPMLGVGYFPSGPIADDPPPGYTRVDVDGRDAFAYDGGEFGRHSVSVGEGEGVLLLTSPVLSRAELVAVARGTRGADGLPTVNPTALRDGWRLLGTEPDGLSLISPVASARNTGAGPAFLASYADSEGSFVTVSSGPGDEASVHAPSLFGTGSEAVTVQGHPGSLTSYEGGGFVLSWLQPPGVLVRVSSFGVDRVDTLKVAEGVRPVTEPGRWADLVEQTQLGEFQPDDGGSEVGREEVGGGAFADGTAWRLSVARTEGGRSDVAGVDLRVALPVPDPSAGSDGTASVFGDDAAAAIVATQTLDQGGRHFAAGVVSEGVDTVEVRRSDGSLAGPVEMVDGAGVHAWVAEVDEFPISLVAFDADGQVLSQVELSGAEGDVDTRGTPIPGN